MAEARHRVPGTQRHRERREQRLNLVAEAPCEIVLLFRRQLVPATQMNAAFRQLGKTAVVDAALRAVVPRVFSDAGETVGFAETGDEYEAARLELARAIVAGLPIGGVR